MSFLPKRRIIYSSTVPGFEGPCAALWVTTYPQYIAQAGGRIGWFRIVKVWKGIHLWRIGNMFRGIVRDGKVVEVVPRD